MKTYSSTLRQMRHKQRDLWDDYVHTLTPSEQWAGLKEDADVFVAKHGYKVGWAAYVRLEFPVTLIPYLLDPNLTPEAFAHLIVSENLTPSSSLAYRPREVPPENTVETKHQPGLTELRNMAKDLVKNGGRGREYHEIHRQSWLLEIGESEAFWQAIYGEVRQEWEEQRGGRR